MKLELINEKIELRYNTLEKNIKSKSNSFYDAYLDLLEETIKYILFENKIEFNASKTCGAILKEEKVKTFLLEKLNLEIYIYEKLFDYIKKCNDHKHKKEKWVGKDSIINFLKIYFLFVNTYNRFINQEEIVFSDEYYNFIFNENEKVNNEILEKLEVQDEKIEEIYKILQNKTLNEEINNKEIKEKNDQLLINQFIKTSTKYNVWIGKDEEFKKTKGKTIVSGVVSILLGIITPVISSIALLMESFSLFGIIWMVMSIVITAYVIRLKKETENEKLSKNTFEKYVYNLQICAYVNTSKEKRKYLFFRIFTYIMIVLDIICLISEYRGFISLLAIFLEILLFASIIIFRKFLIDFYLYYDAKIKYIGFNFEGKKVIIIFDLLSNKFYLENDKENKGRI